MSRPTTFLAAACLAAVAPAYASITFNATFGSSIQSDSTYKGAIESNINAVLGMYTADISTNITVNIDFEENTSGLGQSSTPFTSFDYNTFCTALEGTSSGASDGTAYGSGSVGACGSTNPVTGTSLIDVKSANARAVGLTFSPASDGAITINTQLTDGGTGPCAGSCYSFDEVVEHEVDEVLGLGSSLTNCNGSSCTTVPAAPNPAPEDLFRYSGVGARSFQQNTACGSLGTAYFSIDGGTTNLAGFNNACNGGDFADWDTSVARVQNWAASPNSNPGLGVELTALDVIGYSLQSQGTVPEPSTVFLSASVLSALLLFRRKLASSRKA